MSSILTNTSAMVALQTLNMTNKHLEKTNNEISTGMKVANARDNASIWSIAQTMRSDVSGFDKISESLDTASAAIAVASTAAETVSDLLNDVKEKIVSAQDPTADAQTLQADIDQLVSQIGEVVGSAQFNGLNLVDGSAGTINVLSSLNRDGSGNVTASYIQVAGQNLSSAAGTAPTGVFAVGSGTVSTNSSSFGGVINVATGTTSGTYGTNTLTIDSTNFNAAGGDKISITIGGKTATYTVTANDMNTANGSDPNTVIMSKVADAINALNVDGIFATMGTGTITINNTNTTVAYAISGEVTAPGAGGLSGLASIDVTADPTGALASIETMIQTANQAAAAIGSAGSRVDIQNEFVSKLSDSLTTGIGALVDADMEEASARLQALQVQQQLGIQSLSIANQAPQNVLSLFQ